MITGIGWVSELIEIAGGDDVFVELKAHKSAKDRIVAPEAVVAAAPDVILASWCGKKVVPRKIRARPGWDAIPAVRDGHIVEIKSPLILQPGPAALTDGTRCHSGRFPTENACWFVGRPCLVTSIRTGCAPACRRPRRGRGRGCRPDCR